MSFSFHLVLNAGVRNKHELLEAWTGNLAALRALAFFVMEVRGQVELDNDYDFPAPFHTVEDFLAIFNDMKRRSEYDWSCCCRPSCSQMLS
jgi:hypothetical protein